MFQKESSARLTVKCHGETLFLIIDQHGGRPTLSRFSVPQFPDLGHIFVYKFTKNLNLENVEKNRQLSRIRFPRDRIKLKLDETTTS